MIPWRLTLSIAISVALALLWGSQRPTTGWVWILGCAIGWLLVSGRFGFSTQVRRTISHGETQGMARLAALLTLLIVGSGVLLHLAEPLGISLRPTRAPISLSVAAGAFLFGIGMQMAGRCASGTLASAARADGDFVTTLLALMAGVFLGSLHRPLLERGNPAALPPVVLLDTLPLGLAVLSQLGLLLLCLGSLLALCRLRLRRSRSLLLAPAGGEATPPTLRTVMGLAILLLLLFGASGEPWKVLWGLGLSGAHLAQSAGWVPQNSVFWGEPTRMALLSKPWVQHEVVVVNLGVIYGAFVAGFRSREAMASPTPVRRAPQLLLRHGIGGLLMGYSGFFSYGCNISSFFGGVMSFSLHGWLWLLAAFAGSACWLQCEQHVGAKNAADRAAIASQA